MGASPITRLISALVLGLFFGLFGLFMLGMGAMELWRAQRLSESSQVIEARAFDWSTVTGDGPPSYELHYDFQVGGQTYSASDATGRGGLWQSVPLATWEQSQRTGTLSVRYVPDDPWINEPLDADPDAMGDHLAALGMGALCCLSALVMPLAALFGRQR